MSILSKRSTSSLSGYLTPGDSVSRSESPIEPNLLYTGLNSTNKTLLDQLNTLPNHKNNKYVRNSSNRNSDLTDESSEKENFDDFLENYAIINDSESFTNELNSRNSPVSISSTSIASDLWVLPTKSTTKTNTDLDLIGNLSNLDGKKKIIFLNETFLLNNFQF